MADKTLGRRQNLPTCAQHSKLRDYGTCNLYLTRFVPHPPLDRFSKLVFVGKYSTPASRCNDLLQVPQEGCVGKIQLEIGKIYDSRELNEISSFVVGINQLSSSRRNRASKIGPGGVVHGHITRRSVQDYSVDSGGASFPPRGSRRFGRRSMLPT